MWQLSVRVSEDYLALRTFQAHLSKYCIALQYSLFKTIEKFPRKDTITFRYSAYLKTTKLFLGTREKRLVSSQKQPHLCIK